MKAWLLCGVLLGSGVSGLMAQGLTLKATDVRVVPRDDGFHLFVRQRDGISSVMLTETFEPAGHKLATYSWSGLTPNPVNGAEKRLLNGQFLKGPNKYLISSTVIADPLLGAAFEILIPAVMEYGSQTAPNARYGRINVAAELAKSAKVWFSIRTFAKPYGDYSGAYLDNAFELSALAVVQSDTLESGYYVKGYEDLAHRLGSVYKARDAKDGAAHLKSLLKDHLDLVVCLDETGSMKVDLNALRTELLPGLSAAVSALSDFRLGLVEYRDYGETFVTRPLALSANPAAWESAVSRSEAWGGGDTPEAVIEALDAGLAVLGEAGAAERKLVVFADAPQHDSPRGKLLETDVLARIHAAGVSVEVVMLPVTSY